jgi:hypothetical protein
MRFDGKPPGDETQQRLAKRYPKGWHFPSDSLPGGIFFTDDGEEELCSNCYVDPPSVKEQYEDWQPIENIQTCNLTPSSLRRIRGWIFGSASHSMALLDNFSLLRLIFASGGTADFGSILGQTGHSWPSYSNRQRAFDALVADGVLAEESDPYESIKGVCWLEYQARLITGALRPQDLYYEPYDIMDAKTSWAEGVLQNAIEGSDGEDDEDEDDEDDEDDVMGAIRAAPFLLWEKAEKGELPPKLAAGGFGGMGGNLEMMMMQQMMGRG